MIGKTESSSRSCRLRLGFTAKRAIQRYHRRVAQERVRRRISRSVLFAPTLPGIERPAPGGLAGHLATHACAFENFAPERVSRRHTRRGQPCFLPEQRANRVFFLHRGAVAEFRPSREARAGLAAFVNPGMLFGLQGLRYGLYDRGAEYKMECRALVDAEYCEIASSVAAEGLRTNPVIAETITRSLLNRMQDNQLLLAFAPDVDTERRTIALLWMLATRMGVADDAGNMTIVGFSHAALAELLSCTRSTATRVLSRLEAQGLVFVGRRSLCVPDPDRLIELLD